MSQMTVSSLIGELGAAHKELKLRAMDQFKCRKETIEEICAWLEERTEGKYNDCGHHPELDKRQPTGWYTTAKQVACGIREKFLKRCAESSCCTRCATTGNEATCVKT